MKVVGVLVTYQPDLGVLRDILARLAGQCEVVIADNAPTTDRARSLVELLPSNGFSYLPMHGNRGIGAAQNAAIELAWAKSADAVMLLDDDSIPSADIVARLVTCAQTLGRNAVVGANAIDGLGVEISNAKKAAGRMPACRDMMSSGALIRRDIFKKVGPFDESLFIDGVDFDWGWRARQAGFGLFLCRDTVITHRLGEGRVAGVGLPSPVRHYFQYRNILHLMVRSHTPWQWRISQAVKLTTKLLVIALFMPDKAMRLGFAFAGVKDAIRGRYGPLPVSRGSLQ